MAKTLTVDLKSVADRVLDTLSQIHRRVHDINRDIFLLCDAPDHYDSSNCLNANTVSFAGSKTTIYQMYNSRRSNQLMRTPCPGLSQSKSRNNFRPFPPSSRHVDDE